MMPLPAHRSGSRANCAQDEVRELPGSRHVHVRWPIFAASSCRHWLSLPRISRSVRHGSHTLAPTAARTTAPATYGAYRTWWRHCDDGLAIRFGPEPALPSSAQADQDPEQLRTKLRHSAIDIRFAFSAGVLTVYQQQTNNLLGPPRTATLTEATLGARTR